MTFTLRFDTDNDAFGTTPFERRVEVVACLRRVLDRVAVGECDGFDKFLTILDSNGNDIGRFALKETK